MSVFLFALTLQNTSCDMNIIMWLFSHLACKEVFSLFVYMLQGQVNSSTFVHVVFTLEEKCIVVSYPGSLHTLSLQYETGSYASATV